MIDTEIDRIAILTNMFHDVAISNAKAILIQIIDRSLTRKDFYAVVCEEDLELHRQKRNADGVDEYWKVIDFMFQELSIRND